MEEEEGSGEIAQRICRVWPEEVAMVSVCTCGDNTPFWYLCFGESSRAGSPMRRIELASWPVDVYTRKSRIVITTGAGPLGGP